MKKFLIVCLCAIVGLFSLAGCNNGDDGHSKTPANDDSGWTDFQ